MYWKYVHTVEGVSLRTHWESVFIASIVLLASSTPCLAALSAMLSAADALISSRGPIPGVAAVVAEGFSRTFYRNGHEIGLPILEVPGIHDLVQTGDRIRVDIASGTVTNLSSGKTLKGSPAPEFLLDMLRAGGLIPFLKTGEFLNR